MRAVHDSTGLHRETTEESEGAKGAQDRSSQVSATEFVTRVTRIRGLLKAAREALKEGEVARADRVVAEAQRVLIRLAAGSTRRSEKLSETSGT